MKKKIIGIIVAVCIGMAIIIGNNIYFNYGTKSQPTNTNLSTSTDSTSKSDDKMATVSESNDGELHGLEIEDGWTWDTSSDSNYSYIKFSVKNVGEGNITFCRINAKYMDDNGNVLDSDYIDCTDEIGQNDCKQLEIMHPNDSRYKKVNIKISEVK